MMNKIIRSKKHEKLYGALNENLNSEVNNNSRLTHTFRQGRIILSSFFLMMFRSNILAQAISFFEFSLAFYVWIIVSRPYEELIENIREIMMETIILIIHLIFLGIGVFKDNVIYRLYLDSLAFFGMLFCMFIEYIFLIISTIVLVIQLIKRNFLSKKNKETIVNKFLDYKENSKVKFPKTFERRRETVKRDRNRRLQLRLRRPPPPFSNIVSENNPNSFLVEPISNNNFILISNENMQNQFLDSNQYNQEIKEETKVNNFTYINKTNVTNDSSDFYFNNRDKDIDEIIGEPSNNMKNLFSNYSQKNESKNKEENIPILTHNPILNIGEPNPISTKSNIYRFPLINENQNQNQNLNPNQNNKEKYTFNKDSNEEQKINFNTFFYDNMIEKGFIPDNSTKNYYRINVTPQSEKKVENLIPKNIERKYELPYNFNFQNNFISSQNIYVYPINDASNQNVNSNFLSQDYTLNQKINQMKKDYLEKCKMASQDKLNEKNSKLSKTLIPITPFNENIQSTINNESQRNVIQVLPNFPQNLIPNDEGTFRERIKGSISIENQISSFPKLNKPS